MKRVYPICMMLFPKRFEIFMKASTKVYKRCHELFIPNTSSLTINVDGVSWIFAQCTNLRFWFNIVNSIKTFSMISGFVYFFFQNAVASI